MTIQGLIDLLTRRLTHCSQLRTVAANDGDVKRVTALDEEMAEVETTLSALQKIVL
ncbi:hypothetical protein LBMAG41_10860 [Cyanobium sp.]|nr:hypothetical protein LBMAG41_10860 [Cyanobium sp.]